MTMPEYAEAFSRVIGREVNYYQVPWGQFERPLAKSIRSLSVPKAAKSSTIAP
jgi:hypothetical protein